MNEYYAVCAPGLESILATEMKSLKLIQNSAVKKPAAGQKTPEPGGIEFSGEMQNLYRANLHLRTAGRILLRLEEFYATGFPELKRKISRMDWEKYLRTGQPVALRVSCKKSRLYHSGAVAERVLQAIGKKMGRLPEMIKPAEDTDGNPPQLIIVRIVRDHCTVSLDSSGANLHCRGYRQATAKAPLRETFAAAIIRASGWDNESPLFDPFCGAGTIPIEAALLAKSIPPGINRRFAFQNWPVFQKNTWRLLLEEAQSGIRHPVSGIQLQAADRDAGAIASAVANARRAGVAAAIKFSQNAFSEMTPQTQTGWIITNPPYGVRVRSNHDLRNLYAQFGNILRDKFSGWNVGILCNDAVLIRQTRLNLRPKLAFSNGGVRVKFYCGSI